MKIGGMDVNAGNTGAAVGTAVGIGPVAGGAIGSGIGGLAGGGGLQGALGGLADWDPTKKLSPHSDFQAQNPLDPSFAQQLAWAQGNANNANFAAYNGGQNSFVSQLANNYQNAQGQQNQLIGNLQQQAAGQGPGAQLSHNYLNQAMNQNASNAMGLASSQRGINPAMAARMAGQNAASMNAQAAGQGANMNLQSQLAAQQQLGGALAQNQAMNLGGFQNFNQMANQQALGTQQLAANSSLGAQGLNAQVESENLKAKTGAMGGGLQGAGAILGGLAAFANRGGHVPGQAYYTGDDVKNDTVPAMLSPGEIVIPRSAAEDRDKAIKFLDALKSGNGAWKKRGKKDEE